MMRISETVLTTPLLALILATGVYASEPLPDPLEAGWQGQRVCEKLHEDMDLRVLRCTFPPGVGHERHYHAANFGYALTGGTVRILDADGEREVTLAAGDSYASEGTEWHEIVNIGETTLVYLVVEPKASR